MLNIFIVCLENVQSAYHQWKSPRNESKLSFHLGPMASKTCLTLLIDFYSCMYVFIYLFIFAAWDRRKKIKGEKRGKATERFQ